MKKTNFIYALAAGTMLLGSCSSSDDVNNGAENNDAAQTIVLQVANAGDGLTTRAGRDLYASNADQTIENVKVVIKERATGAIVYTKEYTDWTKTDSKEYNEGRQVTITLKGEDKLKGGNEYTVTAVGYSNETAYKFTPKMTDLTTEKSLKDAITASTTADAEEVFAGAKDVIVKADGSFDTAEETDKTGVTVTLHRQVAGSLGYFMNIPAKVDGVEARYLRLVASSRNTTLTFNNFNSNFTTKDNLVQYIVNGSSPAAKNAKFYGSTVENGNLVYQIDLKDWFPEGDHDGNNILNKEDLWQHPTDVATSVVQGSVLAGKFVIPFAYTTGVNTMELQLTDAAGNILKYWTVNIDEKEKATGKTDPEVNDESTSVFNVVRNHMYTLGEKDENNPGKEDPDVPGPGDQPEDLSKGQNLILKVNDQWEAIHKLILD